MFAYKHIDAMEQETGKPILDRFPLGRQSFEDIITSNSIYVDKTEYVYMLTHSSAKSYFLARPRRFGKSLMCNTLRAYFEGKKELFEGLKISQWENDWVKYPILYLDFVSGNYTTGSMTLIDKINYALKMYEDENGIQFTFDFIKDKLDDQKVDDEIEVQRESRNFLSALNTIWKPSIIRPVFVQSSSWMNTTTR